MCAMAARSLDPTSHGGIVLGCLPSVLIENKPAARVSDMHICPMVTGTVPHVGGPILPPGAVTVHIGGLPAARQGDWATCVGPIDTILMGAFTVDIGPAAICPPPVPFISTPGGGGGSEPYLVNWQWVTNWVAGVNAGVGWNAGAVVAVAAGAVGAVAVGLVVWVGVVKVRDHRRLPSIAPHPHHGTCVCHPEPPLFDEGVTDDAPVYFL